MISRENYIDVIGFLHFQEELKQNDPLTVDGYWSRLRHLLEWAQGYPLPKAATIRPAFPAYLEKYRTYADSQLGASGFTSICKTVRAFFLWAKAEYPFRYRFVEQNWIVSVRPPRMRREQAELHTRELYTVEEVIRLATCPVKNLNEQRTRAAAAFLFLSGMRIGAFASLPIGCVDLDHMRVYQLPERGVMTKNRKAAITYLLQIPELLAVAKSWDNLVREKLGDELYWYAHLDAHGEFSLRQPDRMALQNRKLGFGDDLHILCNLAGVEYKSAHKFRHGHAVYALKHCRTMEEFKSVSQNLMHANMGITDGIYGNLVEDDVQKKILGLASNKDAPADIDLQAAFEAMVRKFAKEKE
jgi:integrase